jgi:hypothetical protein
MILVILVAAFNVAFATTQHPVKSSTYEMVSVVNEQYAGSVRTAGIHPVSDWYSVIAGDSVTSTTTAGESLTFAAGLSVTLKNQIANFMVNASYTWEYTTSTGITRVMQPDGDWARMYADIKEKKMTVTIQHDVYGNQSKGLLYSYFTYETVWEPYNTDYKLEYADGANPPIYK